MTNHSFPGRPLIGHLPSLKALKSFHILKHEKNSVFSLKVHFLNQICSFHLKPFTESITLHSMLLFFLRLSLPNSWPFPPFESIHGNSGFACVLRLFRRWKRSGTRKLARVAPRNARSIAPIPNGPGGEIAGKWRSGERKEEAQTSLWPMEPKC